MEEDTQALWDVGVTDPAVLAPKGILKHCLGQAGFARSALLGSCTCEMTQQVQRTQGHEDATTCPAHHSDSFITERNDQSLMTIMFPDFAYLGGLLGHMSRYTG